MNHAIYGSFSHDVTVAIIVDKTMYSGHDGMQKNSCGDLRLF